LPDDGGVDDSVLAWPASTKDDILASYAPSRSASGEKPRFFRGVPKRCFDIFGAGLLLLVFSLVLLVIAGAILVFDGRPIFFVQQRVGRNGRCFGLLKFRTMVPNAERILAAWKVENPDIWQSYCDNNFKIANDPRLSHVGPYLRRLSLDELPQLWNVFRGDMSLVGPRPLLESELPFYHGGIDMYASVRPGITGLWQVSGRSMTTFLDRARLDRTYLEDVTFIGDLKLLLRTLPKVVSRTGAF
jgi:undecaprenyl-phosphate galactose phosphotransferase